MSNCKKLWHKYPQQSSAQPAYIQFYESGKIIADWDAEIGCGVPDGVYNGVILRFYISPYVTDNDIKALTEILKTYAQTIFGNSILDDLGRKRSLSDDAKSAKHAAECAIENYHYDEGEHCGDPDCESCN